MRRLVALVRGLFCAVFAAPEKDGKVRLLRLDRLNGHTRGARHLEGGELQVLPGPRSHQILTVPAVWHSGGGAWVFIADYAAVAGYVLHRAGSRACAVSGRSTTAARAPSSPAGCSIPSIPWRAACTSTGRRRARS